MGVHNKNIRIRRHFKPRGDASLCVSHNVNDDAKKYPHHSFHSPRKYALLMRLPS